MKGNNHGNSNENNMKITDLQEMNVFRVHTKRQVIIKMNKFDMFITAVCVLFLMKGFQTSPKLEKNRQW